MSGIGVKVAMENENASRIADYLASTGMAASTLGIKACGNPRAVARINTGNAHIVTLNRVMAFIADNPADRGGQ